jgi:hypothetical protein
MDLIAVVRKKFDVVRDDYAPKTSDDVLLDKTLIADLREWMVSPGGGCGLAMAAVGAGLSTLVRLLVRELDFDAVWIQTGTKNASDAMKDAGAFEVAPTGKRKIIVVDEFDPSDKLAVVEYSKSGSTVKMLCLSHRTRSTKAVEFASKWARFDFPNASSSDIDAALRAAGFVPRTLFFDGDVRAAFRSCMDGSKKDDFREGLDIVDAVLSGTDMDLRDILRVHASDPAVVSMGVFENYIGTLVPRTLDRGARISDAFSFADTIDSAMYRTQNWGLQEIYGAMTVGIPATELRGNKKAVHTKKFGTVWSRVYNAKAKSKNIKEINLKKLAHGESHLTPEDLAFQRQMISCATDKDIPRLCGCLGEAQVSMLMRLGFVPYKHDKIKKLLK